LGLFVFKAANLRTNISCKTGNGSRIDRIGFGKLAGGFGKVTYLSRWTSPKLVDTPNSKL
jgi:hypothetical protein